MLLCDRQVKQCRLGIEWQQKARKQHPQIVGRSMPPAAHRVLDGAAHEALGPAPKAISKGQLATGEQGLRQI